MGAAEVGCYLAALLVEALTLGVARGEVPAVVVAVVYHRRLRPPCYRG